MTQTVIITGSGSGIGEATAYRFSKEGYNVVLNGRTREKLDTVAKNLPKDRTLIVTGDVSNPDDAKNIVEKTVEKFGGLNVLVNNAGIARMGTLGKLPLKDFRKLLDINVTGIFNMCHESLPHLKKDGGSIINVSSVSGLGGDWGMFGYNASKGAVSNMTRSLALDLASQGVRVNAVAPSLTKSEMTDGITKDEDALKQFNKRIPMGRPAEASEIASVIAFLAGPDAVFVHGVVLPVDGGVSASNGQPDFTG